MAKMHKLTRINIFSQSHINMVENLRNKYFFPDWLFVIAVWVTVKFMVRYLKIKLKICCLAFQAMLTISKLYLCSLWQKHRDMATSSWTNKTSCRLSNGINVKFVGSFWTDIVCTKEKKLSGLMKMWALMIRVLFN